MHLFGTGQLFLGVHLLTSQVFGILHLPGILQDFVKEQLHELKKDGIQEKAHLTKLEPHAKASVIASGTQSYAFLTRSALHSSKLVILLVTHLAVPVIASAPHPAMFSANLIPQFVTLSAAKS